jgi:hypothetical protein
MVKKSVKEVEIEKLLFNPPTKLVITTTSSLKLTCPFLFLSATWNIVLAKALVIKVVTV